MSYKDIKTWHKKHTESLSRNERLADHLAEFVGSWKFLLLQTAFIIIWITCNLIAYMNQWDPYPFILLNLLFSAQASYTAPIIMMAQNRQNDRDRSQALEDYETNTRAEQEIQELQKAVERIEHEKLDRILLAIRELGEKR